MLDAVLYVRPGACAAPDPAGTFCPDKKYPKSCWTCGPDPLIYDGGYFFTLRAVRRSLSPPALGRWAALPLKDTFSAEIAVGEAVPYFACSTFRLTIAVTARLRWFPAQRGRPSASRSILSQSPGNERRRGNEEISDKSGDSLAGMQVQKGSFKGAAAQRPIAIGQRLRLTARSENKKAGGPAPEACSGRAADTSCPQGGWRIFGTFLCVQKGTAGSGGGVSPRDCRQDTHNPPKAIRP